MDSHLANLFRRSRPQHRRASTKLAKKGLLQTGMGMGMDKRLTPEQLSAIQAQESSLQSARAAGQTPATTPQRNPATPVTAGATEAVGGAASRVQTVSSAPTTAAASPSPAAASSSSVRSSSSSIASSSSVRPSSSSTRSTTSSTSTTTSSSTPSSRSVVTVTSSRSSSSSSSPSASASAAAASSSTTSAGLSTGAIAGVALATLVGLVILGSAIGWLYRKHAQRKYAAPKQPWSKLDDDITPFPHGGSEKPYLTPDEDIYGHSQAPVIGSRRALALARDNAFRPDGSMRPDSDYMMSRDHNNMAGFGAGNGLGHQYGAYPAMHSPGGYDYGRTAHGYDQDQMPTSPVSQQYEPGMAVSAPGNTRQLLGPGGQPQGYGMPMPAPVPLGPVAMGRPAPPQSAAELADREEFMDLPAPAPAATAAPRTNSSGPHLSQYSTYGLAYADSEPDYMPHTATTTGWAGDVKAPHSASSSAGPAPLPKIEPASPLMSGFDFNKRQSQPLGPIAANFASKYGTPGAAAAASTLPMYEDEDESSRQKRMYGEVASAAGVQEPITPRTATDLSHSTNSYETASSFSAHDPSSRNVSQRLPQAPTSIQMPPPPIVSLTPPQPYQHGQPLSPLPEIETPMSTATGGVPLTSSSIMHGQEVNPFENAAADQTLLSTPRAPAFRPPHSAVSSSGATSFPSPRFPPPSPGGMSLPGSVSDSPRGGKRESMFDGDDAYGGI